MTETYKQVAEFAQTWGLLYFVLIFLGVVAYALW
ncbi:MAG: CcoQ/FixQ family Cbb3-type cytochrome c oxidase assembly chaperone, partial [Pseudorhodoplanes sp.]